MRLLVLATVILATAQPAWAGDVASSQPEALSVTIYRNPTRGSGAIKLYQPGGFALVTETRIVHLPVGESRLTFEGVVDGIQPETAIITGLPKGVIEKNRDAALLSPEALVRAAVGAYVTLIRTNKKTGITTRTLATVRSANVEGVMFETRDGIETLRCSGVPETFSYSSMPQTLSAKPTLSALTRTDRAIDTKITLSYLANGFDWAANYVANINADGRTLDLSGWITVANSNSVGLPQTSLQVVAGGLRRAAGRYVQTEASTRVIAHCWPTGTTNDISERSNIRQVSPYGSVEDIIVTAVRRPPLMMPPPASAPSMPPPPPSSEALGDLKLYREPKTALGANQSKQVRLLERRNAPFIRLWSADLLAVGDRRAAPATTLLRMKNKASDQLGLPLPSGSVTVFKAVSGTQLLLGEAALRDTAVDEDVELKVGFNPDLQVLQTKISDVAASPAVFKLTGELALAVRRGETVETVEVTNASDQAAPFELRLRLLGSQHVLSADQPFEMKDGLPLFRLNVPAHGSVRVGYDVVR